MASATFILCDPLPFIHPLPGCASIQLVFHRAGLASGTLALGRAAVIGGLKQRAAVIGGLNQGSSRYAHEWNVPSHRGTTTEERTKETGENVHESRRKYHYGKSL